MSVVNSRCGCCGERKFIENRDAYEARMVRGEAIFCQECLELPDEEAEAMILEREREGVRRVGRALYEKFGNEESTRQAAT